MEVEGEVMPQMLLIFVNDIGFEQNKKLSRLAFVYVFACCVLLSIHQQAFPDWKRGRSDGLQVMTKKSKNLKCSSAPATVASKGSGRDVIILVCKI